MLKINGAKRNRRQRIRNPSSCAFRGIFLFEAVKDGNIEAVSKNLKEEAFTNPEGMGILSKNPLTNLKYHLLLPLHWSHGIALTAAWKQSRPTV